jgi:hypothetical protein
LVLEVANSDEGGRVVGNFCLEVNGSLEHSPILSNIVLRIRHHGDPLPPVQIYIPDV